MPAVDRQHNGPVVLPPAHRRGLRFDKRLLLVYGVLLLDVVVIGSTSLQHVWQPANLIDKVLQNHTMPADSGPQSHCPSLQQRLPIAVKRELGMSYCCGWLALAVMGTLSLLLSYSPAAVSADSHGSRPHRSGSVQPAGHGALSTGRRRSPMPRPTEANSACSACKRTLDEVELQVKLKYLLVAVATFCVFFALNLVVQIHGRFQQSKATVAAFKTYAFNSAVEDDSSAGPGLCAIRRSSQESFNLYNKQESSGGSALPAAQFSSSKVRPFTDYFQAAESQQQREGAADTTLEDGAFVNPAFVNPQSPPYFYWRDVFFWAELGHPAELQGAVFFGSFSAFVNWRRALNGDLQHLESGQVTHMLSCGA
ncbi:hypothetical protein Efla_007087 [Eimeria flavescens]